MPLFTKKLNKHETYGKFDQMVENVGSIVGNNLAGSANITSLAISTESLRDDQIRSFEMTLEGLRTSMEAMCASMGISVENYQIEAAVGGGVISADPRTFLKNNIQPMISGNGIHVAEVNPGEGFVSRPLSLEAYDERDNKNAAMFSIAYNLQASRQDEAGELFFPTVVLSPDQVGITVNVRLMTVIADLYRQISGALDDFARRNIIRAYADHTILKNEMTKVIPVHRPESADKFVPVATLAARTVNLEGEDILTSALAVGKKISLIGISQTDTLLQSGVMDVTDSLEPAIRLQYLYLKVGDDVLRFNVSGIPLSEFTYATQGNYRLMRLNFDTTSILISKDTKQADGSDLDDLEDIVTNDYILRLEIGVTGAVNLQQGDTEVYANKVRVAQITDAATGESLSLTAGASGAVATLFDTAQIIGYELIAYRSNLNRRQRGQLIDTTYYMQAYNVNFSSPITAIHPVTLDGQTDASDLQTLVNATRVRTSNNAMKVLIETAQFLREYIDIRDKDNVPPDMLGVGRFFVQPVYFEEQIDMLDIVDSIVSTERAEDIQMALVNKIRDYSFRMYRDSEYKAAADSLTGGLAPLPEIIVVTDPVISRWLTVTGDLRTLGGQFNMRISSTLDKRVAGKIFITFGVFDETRNNQINPLNFGNMLWSPEVTVVLPISRNGQISKELAVSPRFRHIVNMPILTVLEIENIPDTVNKMPINMRSV